MRWKDLIKKDLMLVRPTGFGSGFSDEWFHEAQDRIAWRAKNLEGMKRLKIKESSVAEEKKMKKNEEKKAKAVRLRAGVQCVKCGITVANEGRLRVHQKYKHDGVGKDISKRVVCTRCKREFANPGRMKLHKCTSSTSEGILAFECIICKQKFKSERGLKIHATKKHEASARLI